MGGETTPEQQYSLRWNDFHTSILSSFRHLRDEEDFVDVTLACDGCSFSAHKVVLSACSPYFRHLLKTNPCQHPIVILRDVQKKDMENLLRFMYNGEVHIGQDHLSDFLKTAKMLQVRGLAEVHTETSSQASLPSHSDLRPPSNTLSTLPITTEMQDLKEELSSPSPPPPPSKKQKHSNDRENPLPVTETDHRSSSPVDNANDMPESLLGQALEGGPTLVHSLSGHKQSADASLQLQSADEEDSNSSDMDICDQKNALQQKMDASDYSLSMMDDQLIGTNGTNASDQTRTPTFPGSILDLQGLLPGPSGLTNSVSSVENFALTSGRFLKNELEQSKPMCSYCGRQYSSSSNLKKHLHNVHIKTPLEKWFKCDHCDKLCKTKHYLMNHQLQKHGIRRNMQKSIVNVQNNPKN